MKKFINKVSNYKTSSKWITIFSIFLIIVAVSSLPTPSWADENLNSTQRICDVLTIARNESEQKFKKLIETKYNRSDMRYWNDLVQDILTKEFKDFRDFVSIELLETIESFLEDEKLEFRTVLREFAALMAKEEHSRVSEIILSSLENPQTEIILGDREKTALAWLNSTYSKIFDAEAILKQIEESYIPGTFALKRWY